MKPSPDICARLSRIGELSDEDVDLAKTALLLAITECPGAPLESYSRHLEKITNEVGSHADKSGPLDIRAEALAQVIARRYGYGGSKNAYEDQDNANLMRVIDRRCGLPVALGIIYIRVARSLGWTIEGINFPARFLVRLEHKGERLILDPFANGVALAVQDMRKLFRASGANHSELTPDHYKPMTNRNILLRLQNHVKMRMLRCNRMEDALEVIQTMKLFAPDEARLWRETGIINARLDNIEAAIAALEEYLIRSGGDKGRYRASLLLQELRRRPVDI